MSTHPVRRTLCGPRARGLAISGSALGLLTMFCLQLAFSNRAAWRSVLEPGPASADQALAALCGSLALALALWLLIAVLVSLLAALGSGTSILGTALASGARVLAPRMLRNSISALLGAAIAAAPAVAEAAGGLPAAAPTPVHSAASGAPNEELSPSWVPAGRDEHTGIRQTQGAARHLARDRAEQTTDGQAGSGQTGGRQTAVRTPAPGPAPHADLRPGWLPIRRPEPATPTPTPSEYGSSPRGPSPSGVPGAGPFRSERPSPAKPEHRRTSPAPLVSSARQARVDADDEVVVRRGDTLWDLAERHLGPGATAGEIAVEWPHWFTANRAVIGSDPDHLVPGERLRPPERGGHSGQTTSRTKAGGGTKASPSGTVRPATRTEAPTNARSEAPSDAWSGARIDEEAEAGIRGAR